jgi:predicted lipoprotein with Yx(FWY)xxD motif
MKKTFAMLPILAMLAVLAALVVAGCGGSSSSTSSGTEASGAEAASETESSGGRYGGEEAASKPSSESKPVAASGGETVAVSLGSAAGVGKVLVDPAGMTLYYFQKDQKGSGKSKCEGACAQAWPPLLAEGEAEAMSGVNASMLGTIERSDGTTQVTYAGWPLYTFVEDKKPGEDNGTDSKAFGASWYPLHGNGEKAGH